MGFSKESRQNSHEFPKFPVQCTREKSLQTKSDLVLKYFNVSRGPGLQRVHRFITIKYQGAPKERRRGRAEKRLSKRVFLESPFLLCTLKV